MAQARSAPAAAAACGVADRNSLAILDVAAIPPRSEPVLDASEHSGGILFPHASDGTFSLFKFFQSLFNRFCSQVSFDEAAFR